MSVSQELPTARATSPGAWVSVAGGIALAIALYLLAGLTYVGVMSIEGRWVFPAAFSAYVLLLVGVSIALFAWARRFPNAGVVAGGVIVTLAVLVLVLMGDQVGLLDVDPFDARTVVEVAARSLVAPLLAPPLILGWWVSRSSAREDGPQAST